MAEAAPARSTAGELASGERVRRHLPVDGMHCAGCASTVERAVGEVAGVSRASVSFATRRLSVEFDPARVDVAGLARVVAKAGFALEVGRDPDERIRRAQAEERALRRRLLGGAALSAPIVAIAMSHGMVPALSGAWTEWLQFALATPVVFWAGGSIHRAALVRLATRSTDMNVLVSLGTLVAYASSAWSVTAGLVAGAGAHPAAHAAASHAVTFEAAAVIVVFVLLGRLLEARATRRASDALRELAALGAARVRIVESGGLEREADLAEVASGMRIRVRPGERIPVDGTVVDGESEVDESLRTGEPMPQVRSRGDRVVAGSLNALGALDVEASSDGEATSLARIVEIVEEAQSSKAEVARFADRVAAVFVPVVLAIAVAAALAWLAFGPAEVRGARALEALVSVLVVACPCALGLATPVAILVASGRAARLGALFHRASAFERLARVREVILDKTGTITFGRPAVVDVLPAGGVAVEELLAAAAAVEARSEHPIARGIVAAARERGIDVPDSTGFSAVVGCGARATLAGASRTSEGEVLVGRPDWIAREIGPIAAGFDDAPTKGATGVLVARRNPAGSARILGTIALADRVRDEATTLAELRAWRISIGIASGDLPPAVEAVGRAIDVPIDRCRGGLSAEEKAALVRDAQASRAAVGEECAFVGDGLNDAAALASAGVGIAVAEATDLAKASADVTLVRGLGALLPAIALSRRTMRVIRQNLAWAFGYNLVLIPLAAGALWPATGFMLPPMAASAAMALSSVSVVLNSLRLRRA